MKELNLKEFYAQSLDLQAPWKVANVAIDGKTRQVRNRVECPAGEVWGDPESGDQGLGGAQLRHLNVSPRATTVRRSVSVTRAKASESGDHDSRDFVRGEFGRGRL